MKVRLKNKPNITGNSHKFNTSSPAGEVIVGFDGGDMDSVYISDLEVFITKNMQFLLNKGVLPEWESVGHWISMSDAFDKKLLITDNYNIEFFEPNNNEEKKRGYRLTGRDLQEFEAQSHD